MLKTILRYQFYVDINNSILKLKQGRFSKRPIKVNGKSTFLEQYEDYPRRWTMCARMFFLTFFQNVVRINTYLMRIFLDCVGANWKFHSYLRHGLSVKNINKNTVEIYFFFFG